LAGTDLVLPAIPALPAALGGSPERAQLVLAAFTGGMAAGLILLGELGARFDQRRLLAGSLWLFAAVSLLCMLVSSLNALIVARFVQGATGAAAAVIAPGMLRLLYRDKVVSALGLFGSIEALAPALAPILGASLLPFFGWRGSFGLLAILAALLALLAMRLAARLPRPEVRAAGSYHALVQKKGFIALALSHACALAALLTIVFAAPALFAGPLQGSIADFIGMQVCGVAVFILTANLTGRLVRRWGARRVILAGGMLMLTGSVLLAGYGAARGHSAVIITGMFVLVNGGLGLRGPPGFHAAIVAAGGDDARGAAAVVIAILGATTLATAAVAPVISFGLAGPALAATSLAALALMLAMFRMHDRAPDADLPALQPAAADPPKPARTKSRTRPRP